MPTNRVQIGRVYSGVVGVYNYGVQISQPGDNVLSPSEPLLFDTCDIRRTGQVYAGGNQASVSSINFTTTKGSLPYIPLVIQSNDRNGNEQINSIPSLHEYIDGAGATSITSTTLTFENAENTYTGTNVFFMVLRIPMQYPFMTDNTLWS